MTRATIIKFLPSWKSRQEKERRLNALRQRDGDSCRRCRRALRFDLPSGHDQAPKIEPIAPDPDGTAGLDNLCLCHTRCNAIGGDQTGEVQERVRRKSEAALLSRSRKRAGRAA